jgi:hypothetical protein
VTAHLLLTADTATGDALVLAEELNATLFADQRQRDELCERIRHALDDASKVEAADPGEFASPLAERLHRVFG